MADSRPYIPYDIPLGDGERARLVLPADLSTAEAERVCGVIRTLAFTDEELAAAEAEAIARAAAQREEAGSLGALIADWVALSDADAGNPRAPEAATRKDEQHG